MSTFIWKAMGWTGSPPKDPVELTLHPHAAQLNDRCPVPGGWGHLGFEYELIAARNAVFKNDTDSPLWKILDETYKGAFIVCDPSLVSFKGMHLVCRQTNEEFCAWITKHRSATMVVNPYASGEHITWCARLVDVVNREEDT